MISHHDVICRIVENSFHKPGVRFSSFLELGAWPGNSVCQNINHMKVVEAVDIRPNNSLPANVTFHHMSTDEFFAHNKKTFDAIFIDADHNEEQVMIDFSGAIRILNPQGLIFLHDTDPITKEFTIPGRCNDSWKVIEKIKHQYPRIDIINLPITSEGLAIVQVTNSTRVNTWQH